MSTAKFVTIEIPRKDTGEIITIGKLHVPAIYSAQCPSTINALIDGKTVAFSKGSQQLRPDSIIYFLDNVTSSTDVELDFDLPA